jgi:hypothetical protein
LNKSLTIVLPVHNSESRLRKNVDEMLELAGELTDRFSILIVDDGSTDDTYDVADELAARFPQISVLRNASRRGLGPALATIRKRVKSDVIVVHDGVTPLDTSQVRRLWQQCLAADTQQWQAADSSTSASVADLAHISAAHAAMAQAHLRVAGFHVIRSLSDTASASPPPATIPGKNLAASSIAVREDRSTGVGRIPPLPAPNFLRAVADFALGE